MRQIAMDVKKKRRGKGDGGGGSGAEAAWQSALATGMGTIYLIASPRGLSGLYWSRRDFPLVRKPDPGNPAQAMLLKASMQIEQYLAGKRRDFDLALDVSGTPFQRKVWTALEEIPFGATLSYQELAGRIGKPLAVRAVGTACGKNPVCLIVPCHRVIATGGGLGGYAGGLAVKERLLALESGAGKPRRGHSSGE